MAINTFYLILHFADNVTTISLGLSHLESEEHFKILMPCLSVRSLAGPSDKPVVRRAPTLQKSKQTSNMPLVIFEKVLVYVVLLTAILNHFSILLKIHTAEASHGSILPAYKVHA